MSEPQEKAAGISPGELRDGMIKWATIDAPWLHMIDRKKFAENNKLIQDMPVKHMLSAHLPVAYNMTDILIENLSSVPGATPFVGPDQLALQTMLKAIAG